MKSTGKIKNELECQDSKLFCHTCLSRGRYLKKITDYEEICVLLFSSFELNKPIEQLVVCWECLGLLRKVVTFLDRARIAQNLLLVEIPQHLNSLSTLVVNCPTKCDTVVYEYESAEPIDDKIDIKEEIIDNSPSLDEIADDGDCLLEERLNIKGDFDDSDPDYDVNLDMGIEESKKERREYKKVVKKYKGIRKDRYNIIEALKINDNYVVVKFEERDLEYWLQKDKDNHWYVDKNYKCEKCFTGFDNRNQFRCHMKSVHLKKTDHTCYICQDNLSSSPALARHLSSHYEYYACKVCPYKCYSMKNICQHFKHDHGRKTECAECGVVFEKHMDMLAHYRSHTTFICDYCGKKRSTKRLLAKHILVNHSVAKCKICNIVFKNYLVYRSHMNLQHRIDQTESAYCVECDMRFDNMLRYKYHIRSSVKHRGSTKVEDARERRRRRQQKYREQHRDAIRERKRNYYLKKKQAINKPIGTGSGLDNIGSILTDEAPVNQVEDARERRRRRQQKYREQHRDAIRERKRNYYLKKKQANKPIGTGSALDGIVSMLTDEASVNQKVKSQELRRERNRRYREKNAELLRQRNREYYQRKNAQQGPPLNNIDADQSTASISGLNDIRAVPECQVVEERHQPAQCPDCGKTYTRKTFMMNHYRLVHLKQTNHYCQLCDKYYLTSHRLSQHKKYTHEGEKRPMDKICNICGRGFSANRILINHVRTHTGERPNCCPHCPAKFVQKYAMKTHIKSIHMKIRKSVP